MFNIFFFLGNNSEGYDLPFELGEETWSHIPRAGDSICLCVDEEDENYFTVEYVFYPYKENRNIVHVFINL